MDFIIQKYSLRLDTNKYTIQDIKNEIDEDITLLVYLGYIDLKNNIYKVKLGNKARCYGVCTYKGKNAEGKNNYEIEINQNYLKVGSPENIHNTIMHECIHSINGCMNHGAKWKSAAAKVNSKFKFTPITRTGHDEGYQAVLKSKYKYEIKCNECGRVAHLIRRSKTYDYCKAGKATCVCGSRTFTCKEL